MDENTASISVAAMGAFVILYSCTFGVDSFARTAGGLLIGIAVDRLYVNRKLAKGEVPFSITRGLNKFLNQQTKKES